MDRYKVSVIFICILSFPYITGHSPHQLPNSDSQDVFHHKNSTSSSTITPKSKSTIRNNSRVYERDGRRGGTPDPPQSGEVGGKRVPTEPTTASDLAIPGDTKKTIDPRYTTKLTTKKRRIRTTPQRISLQENCDYLAYYCLKAYNTGRLCARTLYYSYYTFKNYCMMDYVNCMERFETWQMVHMGPCFNIKPLEEYNYYPQKSDTYLEKDYVMDVL